MIAIFIRWIIDKRKSGESFLIKNPLNLALILFILWTYIEVWWGASYFNHPAPLSLADPRVVFWKNLIRIPLLFLSESRQTLPGRISARYSSGKSVCGHHFNPLPIG